MKIAIVSPMFGAISRKSRVGFTLIELLVVIAIIGILASMLLPVLARAKGKANAIKAMNNAKQIGYANKMYTDENEAKLVRTAQAGASPANALIPSSVTWWPDLLLPFAGNDRDVFTNPAVKPGRIGMGINHAEVGGWIGWQLFEADVAKPAATVFFADSTRMKPIPSYTADPDSWVPVDHTESEMYFRCPTNMPYYDTDPARCYGRFSGRTTAVFLDGHNEAMRPAEIGFQYSLGQQGALWDRR